VKILTQTQRLSEHFAELHSQVVPPIVVENFEAIYDRVIQIEANHESLARTVEQITYNEPPQQNYPQPQVLTPPNKDITIIYERLEELLSRVQSLEMIPRNLFTVIGINDNLAQIADEILENKNRNIIQSIAYLYEMTETFNKYFMRFDYFFRTYYSGPSPFEKTDEELEYDRMVEAAKKDTLD
jgi:hypothetical protein